MFDCSLCKKNIATKTDLIECDGICGNKFHKICTKLNVDELQIIKSTKNIIWKCDVCLLLCSEPFRNEINKIIDSKFDKYFEYNEWRLNNLSHRINSAEIKLIQESGPGKEGRTTEAQHQPYKFIFNRKAVIITSAIIVSTILIGILIVATNHWFRSSIRKNPDDDNDEIGSNSTLRFLKRDKWSTRPPSGTLDKLKLPSHRVIISHTATSVCEDMENCVQTLKNIQAFHMDSQNWSDIGYNFLISSDGLVYEGRGWDNVGAHTKGYNFDSVGVSFIGTFNTIEPTKKQLNAAKLLIEDGFRRKKLATNYHVYGARQFGATESPGNTLYNIIKSWPNWSAVI